MGALIPFPRTKQGVLGYVEAELDARVIRDIALRRDVQARIRMLITEFDARFHEPIGRTASAQEQLYRLRTCGPFWRAWHAVFAAAELKQRIARRNTGT
jgi:hypothetical protein